jgi:hypothetical protein
LANKLFKRKPITLPRFQFILKKKEYKMTKTSTTTRRFVLAGMAMAVAGNDQIRKSTFADVFFLYFGQALSLTSGQHL